MADIPTTSDPAAPPAPLTPPAAASSAPPQGGAAAAALAPQTGAAGAAPAPSPFLEGLTDEQREFLNVKGMKLDDIKLAPLVEQYRQAERKLGMPADQLLPAPKQGDDVLAWPGWEKMGVPKTADEVAIERPQMPDGFVYDETLEAKIKEAAPNLKLLPRQVQGLVNTFAEHQKALAETVAAEQKQAETQLEASLKSAWGEKFEANKALAGKAYRTLAGDAGELADKMEGVLGAPALLQFFHKLGTLLGEDKIGAMGSGMPGAMGPASAKDEIGRLYKDAEFMKSYANSGHPDHKAAVERMEALTKTSLVR